MIDIIMIFYLLFICVVASVTDWKKGKIYNRWLTFGMCPGMILVVLYYMQNPGSIFLFLTNLAAALVIAILFFALKLWGAGDSKLWLFVNFLYPTGWYVTTGTMLFPSMLLFLVIFVEAYLYLIAESIWYRFFRKEKGVEFEKIPVSAEQIWNLCFSIAFLSVVYMVCAFVLKGYYESNRIFFAVVGILLTNRLVTLQIPKKKLWTVLMMAGYLIFSFWFYGGFDLKMLGLTVLLVVVTHFSLKFADKYNYEWIPTSEVREGMILSYFAVQQFVNSRVKGLPKATDETTKSRISEEEAAAVRRWETSKYGQEKIMVVRYIPFAIFILIGIITYLIGVWYLK